MLSKELIGKVIQCHIDEGDPETFVVGRLVFFDSDWFLLQDISSIGKWNGLALFMISDLVLICEDSQYLKRINKLLNYWGGSAPSIPSLRDNVLIDLISTAKDTDRIIGCELCASGYRDINGIVISVNDCSVEIEQFDEFGCDDGISYIDISAITRLYVGDEECVCLEILREKK